MRQPKHEETGITHPHAHLMNLVVGTEAGDKYLDNRLALCPELFKINIV